MADQQLDEIRSKLGQIRSKVQSDPNEMNMFQADMSGYLEKNGISGPAKDEVLREAGAPNAKTACSFVSCICTSCGIATLSV